MNFRKTKLVKNSAKRASLSCGNTLYFNFASKVVHLFDPKTEEGLLF